MKKLFKSLYHLFFRNALQKERDRVLIKLQDKLAKSKNTTERARLNAYIGLLHTVNEDTLKVIDKHIDNL